MNGTMKYVKNGSFIEPFINYCKGTHQAAIRNFDSVKAFKTLFTEI